MTTTQIYSMIAANTAQYLSAYNVTASDVLNAFNVSYYNNGARATYKLGSGLTVTGTPSMFGNNALINEG